MTEKRSEQKERDIYLNQTPASPILQDGLFYPSLTGPPFSYNLVLKGWQMERVAVIILAAGKGKRMRSGLVKVLHPLLGRPMLSYPLEVALGQLRPEKTLVVIGHQGDEIRASFSEPRITFVEQEDQLGTGHAVSITEPILRGFNGTIVILCGDIPLISSQTLRGMLNHHWEKEAVLTLLTSHIEDPAGYGRVVRGVLSGVRKVVEEKDATDRELEIKEINSGIYCVQKPFLFQTLGAIKSDNAQGEYYLTDIIEIAHHEKKRVCTFYAPDPWEIMGVNTRADLAKAEEVLGERVRQHWMSEGVTIQDPQSVYIEPDVRIGRDTVIHSNCYLRGRTSIGEECLIGPQVEIIDSQIGDRVRVRFCTLITESRVENDATVGPFSHLRPLTHLEKGVRIGNFVEVKKSRIRKGTKANHLSYIGDAEVGEGVNIGAGTITCNYDGYQKHQTIIEEGVFMGSNTALVAPVKIGKGALVG
ncbi:MAG: bifunctional UDP-N-acetylglucosamine diphosphorylase/glucosamine-1-phosphate N-acetyltransferase GlmU, partial [Deltaproteobacteria bacterium]|nr:bifunctional UDP-N-acetylglucosamine diphosphorylase/glucosamine-1-phosphate N-acetyltransferase GlmU [Deltaproteobacteria bacterium]